MKNLERVIKRQYTMKQNKFVLNQDEFFFLKCGNIPIQEVTMPYFLDFIWPHKNRTKVISQMYSFDFGVRMIDLLSAALENELLYDEQIYVDIGLAWDYFENPSEAKPIP